jgi:NAD(P)-dependent dehydrogenase (short-subunit alcohol dehydrogenase family)
LVGLSRDLVRRHRSRPQPAPAPRGSHSDNLTRSSDTKGDVMNIARSTALVTGSNRGLGRHLANELINRGATVYAAARNPDAVDLPGVKAVALDITDRATVANAAEIASDVTLLINNAGSSTVTDLFYGDESQIRFEMDTHFFGTLSVIRAFAPKISSNGGGSILNILSALSWVSFPRSGAYCAAKSAEWSMTNALRLQLAEQNIRVAGLHVGYMDTDMTASLNVTKSNPADIAKIAIDGVEQDLFEIVADDVSREMQAALAGGVVALYPQLQKSQP